MLLCFAVTFVKNPETLRGEAPHIGFLFARLFALITVFGCVIQARTTKDLAERGEHLPSSTKQ